MRIKNLITNFLTYLKYFFIFFRTFLGNFFLLFSLDFFFFFKYTNHINYYYYSNKFNLVFNNYFFLFDYFFLKYFFWFYSIKRYNLKFRYFFRLNQLNWKFYKNHISSSILLKSYFYLNYGLKSLWKHLTYWFLGLILFVSIFYFLMYIRLLPFNKVLFEWFLIVMFLYWLLSGFIFFIKKYQYSKFTSVIQRFWKRSYILFWCIESGTFMCFFYLTLNASEEPTYMYDQMKLYKFHLFSWRWFLQKLIIVVALIIIGYYLQLNLKWSTFSQQSIFILIITLILLYSLWLEFYQFFHIINFYGNLMWVYDYDEFLWNLEIEFRRTRIANNLVAICLLAKFWHLVFIFVFWVFFILRINEIFRIRYTLLVANLQNFIILYIMSWLYMYPWLKFLFKGHLDNPYYWFFLNARYLGIRVFFTDIKIFLFSLVYNFYENYIFLFNFKHNIFFYWYESSEILDLNQFKKHIIRDYIITNLK